MFGSNRNEIIGFIQRKISLLDNIESVSEAPDGAINVIISNGIDRRLREDVLDIGRRALVPVRVFYRMADGRAIGEQQIKAEAIEDFYTPLYVPGFAGSISPAPPEEVAKEVDGAQKLTRIRSAGRGRPVTAWKMGSTSLTRGQDIVFRKACCLQWTMGRTFNVEPGARGRIVDLATKRPLLYLSVGDVEGVELPVHLLGHAFELVNFPKTEAKKEGDGPGLDGNIGYVGTGVRRLIGSTGFKIGWGDTGSNDYPWNSANYSPDGNDSPDPYIPTSSSDEDMISSPETMDPSNADRRFDQKKSKSKEKKLVLGRK